MPSRRSFLSRVAGAATAATLPRSAQGQELSLQAALPHGTTLAPWLTPHVPAVQRLIAAAMQTTHGWDRLAELCDTFGSRLSGSASLERAIEWAASEMRTDGFDAVRLQPVTVPRWTRGVESLEIIQPVPSPLVMLGLGGSIGTPPEGVTAPLLIVHSFEELQRRAPEAAGRIVLFDVPYTGYGQTVTYRTTAAVNAARAGAVAALVRSVGPVGLRTPHTGSMSYAEGTPRIPAAAIPVEDSRRLARMLARGQAVTLRLTMGAKTETEVTSANVIAEIRGREHPDEIVLIGGHFDSWDPGTGASDDGVGCIVTWEAARLMLAAGLRPRRTVRLVLFANEEHGLRGAHAYRDAYEHSAADHVCALESDNGVFEPMRFGITGSEAARQHVVDIGELLAGVGFPRVTRGGGGADIGPIAQAGNVPMIALIGDSERYFTIHHTAADTVERIEPGEVAKATAGIAALVWVIADMEERLPR